MSVALGIDCEFANALLGAGLPDAGRRAAYLLHSGFVRLAGPGESPVADDDVARDPAAIPAETLVRLVQGEWGRLWLRGALLPGGCAYVDLGHLELDSPECRSVGELLLAWRAMLEAVEAVRADVQRRLPRETTLWAATTLNDGHRSWGHHFNIAVAPRIWERLVSPGPVQDGYAAFVASSILLSGAGDISVEGRPHVTQRSRFMGSVVAEDTTGTESPRPIVNRRREGLSGGAGWDRLHHIAADSTLSPVGFLASRGAQVLVIHLLERYPEALADLALVDPVAALHAWDADPGLCARAPLVDGRSFTALQMLSSVVDRLRRHARSCDVERDVPGAQRLLGLACETVELLSERRWQPLARRLQWVLRLSVVEARRRRVGLDALRQLNMAFDALDPSVGLYSRIERAGGVDQVPDPASVAELHREPPVGRAWVRTHILREAQHRVVFCDWDEIVLEDPHDPWGRVRITLPLRAPHTEDIR